MSTLLARARFVWLTQVRGHQIGQGAAIHPSARLVSSSPGDIVVGARTVVGSLALLSAVSPARAAKRIVIGSDCTIGGNALIGPGVTVGDRAVVQPGSVVLEDVPADTTVSGNPAVRATLAR
jgi:acetyltransferase-like isoleucine patch superfamily enzyme